MKKLWYEFKFWFDGIFNPSVVGYKMEPIIEFIKKIYQTCTPWYGFKRKLMNEFCCNYGKLLETGLSYVSQRTRDGKSVYYILTTYFGHVKLYRKVYVDKQTKRNVNAFLNLFVPALCGTDKTESIIEKKECLYKGWALTRNQAMTALKEIRKLAKDLIWDAMVDAKGVYSDAETAYKYLCGKHVYFMYDGITEDECEKELRVQIYLMQRDLKPDDFDKYVYSIQECMYLSLEPKSDDRNKKLKKLLKDLMKKIEKDGYKSFWLRYFS